MKDNKAVISWVLYDFANSPFTTLTVTFIYATFFTKMMAPDEIQGTTLWSRGITVTAISVAVLSPFLGAFADQGGFRKLFLGVTTLGVILASGMLFLILPGQPLKALIWFVTGNICFEMSNVFYNAFLPGIAHSKHIGRISGYGWGMGYIGGLLCMVVAMVGFVSPEVPWFGLSKELGENIRATNLLVAFWFCVFSLPMFIFVKSTSSPRKLPVSRMLGSSLKELKKTFLEISKYRQIFYFLIARLIYNDGLITIFAFGGIYASGTFHFSFREIMLFGIVLNIFAGTGAVIMGFLDDHIGGKKTIQISLWGLIIAGSIAVCAPTKGYLWVAGILVGIFAGPNQSASRSLMARFIPVGRENEFFGFFAFSGKFTAFLGPFFLGILTEIFQSQRAGVCVVVLFFLIGSLLLMLVNEEEGILRALEGN